MKNNKKKAEKLISIELTKKEWMKLNAVLMAAVLTLAENGDFNESAMLSGIGIKITETLLGKDTDN